MMEHGPLLWTCCFTLIKNVKYTQFKRTITSPVTDDKGQHPADLMGHFINEEIVGRKAKKGPQSRRQ